MTISENERYLKINNRLDRKKQANELRDKKQKLMKQIEQFSVETEQPAPKCISDKILLYSRYLLYKIVNDKKYHIYRDGVIHDLSGSYYNMKEYTEEKRSEMMNLLNEKTMMLYKNFIRGEMKYINSHPFTVAAALVYLAGLMSDMNITQTDIYELCGVSTNSLVKTYRGIYSDYKRLGWNLNDNNNQ